MDGEHRQLIWRGGGGKGTAWEVRLGWSRTQLSTALPGMSEVGLQEPQNLSSLHRGHLQNRQGCSLDFKLQQSQMSGSKNPLVCIPRSRSEEKNQRLLQRNLGTLCTVDRGRSRCRRPMQAWSLERGKLGEGVEWQSPLCWSQTERSVLLPGRAEPSPLPGLHPCAKAGGRALRAVVAALWKGQHSAG